MEEYIQKIKAKFDMQAIEELFNKLKHLKVLVIGDTIIDEYCFVEPRGGAIKDPMCTVDYLDEEIYAGGILAIANHISNFVSDLKLVTMIGDKMSYKDYIINSLNSNVSPTVFVKSNSPTTRKRRYISKVRNEKLFMIEYVNDLQIDSILEQEVIEYLEKELPSFDLVIVADYGHGFISNKIIDVLEKKAKYLAVNVQTNSANLGFNYVTKYSAASFISMDGAELKFAVGDRHGAYPDLMKKLNEKKGFDHFMVTTGKEGVAYFNKGNIHYGKALTANVKDIVGAGDAVFSLVSLLACYGCDTELLVFLANCAGGVKVSIMGNKESVSKEKLFNFIKSLFKSSDEEYINKYFSGVHNALENLDKTAVNSFVKLLLEVYDKKSTIYAFGNGGSGATASHFCGDLIKGVSYGLDKRFRAVCLNDNIPAMMSIANDVSFDDIFVEQLKNFLEKDDLVVGISGSGNSINVIKALEYAKNKGVKSVAISGFKGGKIKDLADLSLHVPINDMEITEDVNNLIITHCVKQILTKELKNYNLGEKHQERIS